MFYLVVLIKMLNIGWEICEKHLLKKYGREKPIRTSEKPYLEVENILRYAETARRVAVFGYEIYLTGWDIFC